MKDRPFCTFNSSARKTNLVNTSAQHRIVSVDLANLERLDARPAIWTYLRSLWDRRHFIFHQGRSRALTGGRGTYLGAIWLILNPIMQVAVYALVFGTILGVSKGMDNFVGFLVLGVVYFGFLTGGLSAGSGLIQQNRALISSFNFPRAAVPVSTTVKALIDHLIPAVVAVVLALLTQLNTPPSWTVLLVAPLYLLIHLFGLGLTFFVARATAFVPDLKNIVNLAIRALFFLSGVFFSIDRFDTHPTLSHIVEANPFYQFLMAVRTCVLDGEIPSIQVWEYLALWTVGVLVFGFVYFWQAEERYGTVK